MTYCSPLSMALLLIVSVSAVDAQDWQPLFDGLTFHGLTAADGSAVDAPAWEVTDGMLHLDRSKGRGGNLLSAQTYGDFELVFEWKLAPGANNGIKYRVNDFDGRLLGIEYQVIDDAHHSSLTPKHKTASLYDIYEPVEHDLLRKPGEFNRSRILVQQNRIEHWLNGHLVSNAQVGDAEWQQRIADSKFADVDGFGVIPTGRIMITDHNDEVWYRNLFIRRLDIRPAAVGPAMACITTAPVRCCVPRTTCRPRRAFLTRLRRR